MCRCFLKWSNFEHFFLLSDKHNYTDLAYMVYLILLHFFSAVQISHHQVGNGYTKRVKARGLSLQTAGITVLYSNYNSYNSKNGIISIMRLV